MNAASIKHMSGATANNLTLVRNMDKRSWMASAMIFLIMLTALTTASAAEPLALQDMSFAALPGDKVQIRLTLSGPAPEPGTFTIDNPARIALDLPNTRLDMEQKSQNIGVGIARSMQAVEAAGRTRVVLSLVRLVPYATRTDGNSIIVTLGEAARGAGVAAVAAPAPSSSQVTSQSRVIAGDHLKSVDFRRGERGEGRIIVDLSNPRIVSDITEEGGKIVVEFISATLPAQLERRLNVIDFATPVKTVDTFTRGGNVRVEISALPQSQHLAYQTGETLVVEVKPISKEEDEAQKKDKFGYTGEKLSLNFQNIEVRAVLQLLADFTGLNIVTSDTVTGNVTLRLKNVPWDQALDIILKARGLDMRKMGDVVMIAPAEEIAAREKLELEAKKQLVELAPLQNESIQVNYAKAADLAALIKSEDNTLLSERGAVSVDERTNRILIRDIQENLNSIRKLVNELDIPMRQVVIESRVVLASDLYAKELGARFGVNNVTNNNPLGETSSTIVGAGANSNAQILLGGAAGFYSENKENTGYNPDPMSDRNERFNVNLPASTIPNASTLGVSLVKLPVGALIELELSAAQAEGQTELISSPRVLTADKQKAYIEQGVEIAYQQSTSSGATTVKFKKAVLGLEVTPYITPDNRVIMDLLVTKDKPDYSRSINGVPPIDTQKVETRVLVDNGETVVLGGIFEQAKADQTSKVPLLGDIPVLGYLFRTNYTQDAKTELLIFVTPKMLKEGALIK